MVSFSDSHDCPHSGKKIPGVLIVDNSEFIRSRLAELLGEIPLAITQYQAGGSGEAYEIIWKYNPVLAIIDIHLPGDNGIKILEKVKAMNNHIMVIILTSYNHEQYRKRCIQLGATAFFSKSEDMEKLPSYCYTLLQNITVEE